MASSFRMVLPKMGSLTAPNSITVIRRPVSKAEDMQKCSRAYSASSRAHAPLLITSKSRPSSLHSPTLLSVIASRRTYSSETAAALVHASQNLGMGNAAIGLGGSAVGIGLVFASLLQAVARNPQLKGQLFTYAILGFAFVEAMGLFGLMTSMMCKFL